MKKITYAFVALAVLVAAILLLQSFPERSVLRNTVEYRTDTVVVRDTVRSIVPVPRTVFIVRTDTVFLYRADDSVRTEVLLPVERMEYRTEDYAAVVEGYLPSLVSMELFPKVKYITNTEIRTVVRKPRWGAGIQLGYGYGFGNGKFYPYVGVGVQYNLFTW